MTTEQQLEMNTVEKDAGSCIAKNKVVSLHYRLSDVNGELENSHGGQPMVYLQGHRNIISGLEKAMLGRKVGDRFTVALPPESAYGEHFPNREQRIPIKHLFGNHKSKNKGRAKLNIGQVVSVQTDQGPRQVTIMKVGRNVVDVDTNHPYAGRTLTFDIEVVALRDATSEEIAHRHVHGDGGCQH